MPQVPSPGAPPAGAAHAPGERCAVLVVDDNQVVRDVLQVGLERNGFKVLLASGGWEALRLYSRHRARVAVVLLDICMPDLDGPQTLEALRAVNPDVQACFMSGNAADGDQEQLRWRCAAAVIAKPFVLEELANLLRTLVEGPHGAAPAGAPRGPL